ncbi:MAG: SAM-dependent methyltransferase [Candidatus Bathyarchaeota archaeon]|nr:SAM-dependent methyltransferase [Candidatus Bathyarchaeota archaeon]
MDSLQLCYDEIQRLFSIDPDINELERLLKETGFLNPGGSFYKERVKKFHEVINFSVHLAKALDRVSRKSRAVLLECGCGRSYLSFFLSFLLSQRENREIYFLGVDQDPSLIEKCDRAKDALKLRNISFSTSKIIDFQPPEDVERIHGVFSLHACDTATDETIAKGILLNARYVIVVPCCQREIVRQMSRALRENEHPFKGVLGKYSLKESLGITVTEILRTLVLEIAGYEADVFKFLSSRYTPKNTMIRAEKTGRQSLESLQNYRRLKSLFRLNPRIEEYLPNMFKDREFQSVTCY